MSIFTSIRNLFRPPLTPEQAAQLVADQIAKNNALLQSILDRAKWDK